MSLTDIWNTIKRLRGWSSSWSRFINIQALSLSSTFINMRLSRPRVLVFLQQIKGSKNGRNSPCGQRGLFPKSQEVRGRQTLLLFHVSNYMLIKTKIPLVRVIIKHLLALDCSYSILLKHTEFFIRMWNKVLAKMSLITGFVPQWASALQLYISDGLKFRTEPGVDSNSPGCSRSDMWTAWKRRCCGRPAVRWPISRFWWLRWAASWKRCRRLTPRSGPTTWHQPRWCAPTEAALNKRETHAGKVSVWERKIRKTGSWNICFQLVPFRETRWPIWTNLVNQTLKCTTYQRGL